MIVMNPKGEPNEMDRNQILDRKAGETELLAGITHTK